MARDVPVSSYEPTAQERASSETDSSDSTLLNRRSYLKTAGAAAAAAVGIAGAVPVAADEYDVVELSANERHVVRLGDGDIVENVLFDQRANNAQVVFNARATNWTIRNVGVVGRHKGRGAYIGCCDNGGGTSRIENVYLGDGALNQHRVGLGIWVAPDHSGHLDIERVNIQEMGDNSFYCSAPASSGGGTVSIDRCYSRDSWVSHYRLPDGEVTNSVAVNTAAHRDGRGVWAWGNAEVRNCHLQMNGRHNAFVAGDGASIDVWDTEWDNGRAGRGRITLHGENGRNPEDFVPDGCPSSAEMAASGEGESSGDDWDPETEGSRMEIEGVGEYRIEVDGSIEPAPEIAQWVTTGEAYDNDGGTGYAEWYLTGSHTAWLVNGKITAVETDAYEGDQELSFTLDGEAFDPADLEEEKRLEIEGVGEYRIEVDGSIEPAPEIAQWVTTGEAYDNDGGTGYAEWYLTGSHTAWLVKGEIVSIDTAPFDGNEDLEFSLAGEEINPQSLG